MKHAKKLMWIALALMVILLPISCDQPSNPKRPKNVGVRSISLDKSDLILILNETGGYSKEAQLKATVSPSNATNKKVTWSSDKPNIAEVDKNGLVTAKAAGDATITAKAGARTATCTVTVYAAYVAVTGVTLDSTLSVMEGGAKELKAEVAPSTAINQKVKWTVADPTVVSIYAHDNHQLDLGDFTHTHDIMVRGLKANETTKITVTTEDGDLSKECTVTVTAPVPVPYSLMIRTLRDSGPTGDTTPDSELVKWTGSKWTPTTDPNIQVKNHENNPSLGNGAVSLGAVTVAYVYPPIQGSFTWTVKAKVTEVNGGGLIFARFFEPEKYSAPATPVMAGLMHNGQDALRRVFYRTNPSLTLVSQTPNPATLAANTEYSYQIIWDAEAKTTTINMLDATGAAKLTDTITSSTTDVGGDASLIQKSDVPWSPAFWVANNTIEITEMSVVLNSDRVEVDGIFLPATLAMDVGDKTTLQVTYDPLDATYKGVTWESDNQAVATVDKYNGRITAITEGTVNITATEAINGLQDTCIVTVSTVPVASVTIVTMDQVVPPSPYELIVGDDHALPLTVKILPTNATPPIVVEWESSNTNIATVVNGLVTGVMAKETPSGTANITATANGVSSTAFVVDVVHGTSVAESITVTPTTWNLYRDQTYTLSYEVLPTTLEDEEATWHSEDTTIATVDATTGLVTPAQPIKAGTVNIVATSNAKDAGGVNSLTASCAVTVIDQDTPHRMTIKNMGTTVGNITTPNTPNILALEESNGGKTLSWSGSQVIVNNSNGTLSNFDKGTLVYLEESVDPTKKFTWTGTISLAGASSGNYGIVFGTFVNLPETLPETMSTATPLYFAGSRLVLNLGRRSFWTNSADGMRGDGISGNADSLEDNVFSIRWDGTKYTVNISGTSGDIVTTSGGPPHTNLFTGATARYPGFCLQGATSGGVTATIKNLTLTLDE